MTLLNPNYNNPDNCKAALFNKIIFTWLPSDMKSLVTAVFLYGESIAGDRQQELVRNKIDDMNHKSDDMKDKIYDMRNKSDDMCYLIYGLFSEISGNRQNTFNKNKEILYIN